MLLKIGFKCDGGIIQIFSMRSAAVSLVGRLIQNTRLELGINLHKFAMKSAFFEPWTPLGASLASGSKLPISLTMSNNSTIAFETNFQQHLLRHTKVSIFYVFSFTLLHVAWSRILISQYDDIPSYCACQPILITMQQQILSSLFGRMCRNIVLSGDKSFYQHNSNL